MKKFFGLIITAIALVVASAAACGAKSYHVEHIHVEAVVSADGAMRVTENIAYVFDGSFSFAFRDIPLKPGERMTRVAVRDEERDYEWSEARAPGTFFVTETDRGVRITWFYSATDEKRAFDVSYVMEGLIRRYEDTAELYFQFVGPDWDRSIGDVRVKIRMPDGIRPGDLRAWAHGPLHGVIAINEPTGEVELTVTQLPPRTFWEARVLCPPEFFPDVAVEPGGPRLAAILDEEARWAAEANARREASRRRAEIEAARAEERRTLAGRLLPISIIAGLGALGVAFVLFRRHGWPHAVRSRAAPGDIPSDRPPAVVSYLMNRTVSGRAIVATLVDLADKGYLEIRQSETTSRNWLGREKRETDYAFELTDKTPAELEGFERDLIDFLTREAGDGRGFTMSGLKEAASKHRSDFHKWFRKWVKSVSSHSKTFGFYEPYPVGAMIFNAVCGAVVAGFGLYASIATASAVGLPAVGGGVVQALWTAFLNRRTREGKREYEAWRAFKGHLKSVGRGIGPVRLDSSSWGTFLAAAILFGMHKKLIPNLELIDSDGRTIYPVWFYAAHGGSFEEGISGLSSGLSTMIDSVSTSVSSASGAGGGASVGGGGGSGGGGGGAG